MATESTCTDLVLRSRNYDGANCDHNPARLAASDQSPSKDESQPNPTIQVQLNIMYVFRAPYNGSRAGMHRRRPRRAPRAPRGPRPPRASHVSNFLKSFGRLDVTARLRAAEAIAGLGPWTAVLLYSLVLLTAEFVELSDFFIWFWNCPVMQFFGWLKTIVWVFVGLVVSLCISAHFTTTFTDFVLALVTLILNRE